MFGHCQRFLLVIWTLISSWWLNFWILISRWKKIWAMQSLLQNAHQNDKHLRGILCVKCYEFGKTDAFLVWKYASDQLFNLLIASDSLLFAHAFIHFLCRKDFFLQSPHCQSNQYLSLSLHHYWKRCRKMIFYLENRRKCYWRSTGRLRDVEFRLN